MSAELHSDDPRAVHWPEDAQPVTLCGLRIDGRRLWTVDQVAVSCSWCRGLLRVFGVLPRVEGDSNPEPRDSDTRVITKAIDAEDPERGGTVGS